MKCITRGGLLAAALTLGMAAQAVAGDAVRVFRPKASDGTELLANRLSDNGKWALVLEAGDQEQDNPQAVGGSIVNVGSGLAEVTIPGGPRLGIASVNDITDDGQIVVGSADGQPAYWDRQSAQWVKLSVPQSWNGGELYFITPDGRRALGVATRNNDFYAARPVLYDMEAGGTIIDTPNLPYFGMNKSEYTQNAPHGLSADGTTFIGMVGESFMLDLENAAPGTSGAVMWAYVYDVASGTYTPIGWTIDDDTLDFHALYPESNFIDNAVMSPSGEWVGGALRLVKETVGDVVVPYLYNVRTGEYTVYDEGDATAEMATRMVDDNGTVYACQPWDNPYPTAFVRHGNYFYSFDQIWRQVYGFDLMSVLGADGDISGRPLAISGDGLTFCMMNTTDSGYMLQMGERLDDAAAKVDLLGNWTASPADGSSMATLKTVTVTFDRNIDLVGNPRRILVTDDATGATLLRALQSSQVVDGRKLSVGLVTTDLEAGAAYTLTIPEGMVSIAGDPSMVNGEIAIHYSGRANEPVKLLSTYPADGSSQATINGSDAPVLLTYDSSVAINTDCAVRLYEEGYTEAKATLYAGIATLGPNVVVLFPGSTQYLYEGSDYRIEIPEGFVTDISGAGPSEAATLHFKGAYVRNISADDTTLFSADGNVDSYTLFLTFDGDQLEPVDEMADWGFTSVTPWWGVTDSSGDLCFASHSMYKAAGPSNDWMMTPQIFIPDDKVTLIFDAQSYRKNKADRLEVVAWSCDDGYNTLDSSLAARINEEGTVIFDEQLTPGQSEEELAGDWTHYTVPLADWAGKNVYIAFVNRNNEQSAIFVDNIKVEREMDFLTTFRHPSRVVNASGVAVSGRLTIATEGRSFSKVELRLLDGSDNEIEALPASTGTFTKGSNIDFAFNKELPLTVGSVNNFVLEVTLDGQRTRVADRVLDLTFEPERRVVVEEFSGMRCSNCPLGFLGMEKLEEAWPGRIIPVVLRCYQSDPVGSAVTDYASYLGGNAAPAARIDRQPEWVLPAASNGNLYYFSQAESGLGDEAPLLWRDVVAAEMDSPAEASVEFAVDYNANTRALSIPVTVTYALNAEAKALRLFAVILEDKVTVSQLNGFGALSNPELAPWSNNDQVVEVSLDGVARGTIGLTYSGTADLLPASLAAGEPYAASLEGVLPSQIADENVGNAKVAVMLIDGATGLVVNANVAHVGSHTGALESVVADSAAAPAIIVEGGRATAFGSGTVTLEAYSADGILLGRAAGCGSAALEIPGGLTLLRATDASAAAPATVKAVR